MYKTIVVHIDGSPDQDSRLLAAAQLAKLAGAHLVGSAATGVSWLDFTVLASAGGGIMPTTDYEALRAAVARRLAEFEDRARRLDVDSFEARLTEDHARNALMLQSRYADLVVLSQDDDAEVESPRFTPGLPEYLALRGARPVLVVPPGYAGQRLPGKVVVGWDGSLHAVRAIDAALPLLRRADAVRLALVNPDGRFGLHGEEPGADMALYLARHGVHVEVLVERGTADAGDVLLRLARDSDAGLVVAGAFGHSRYREWVLGGVTRDLLECATVPVLLAH